MFTFLKTIKQNSLPLVWPLGPTKQWFQKCCMFDSHTISILEYLSQISNIFFNSFQSFNAVAGCLSDKVVECTCVCLFIFSIDFSIFFLKISENIFQAFYGGCMYKQISNRNITSQNMRKIYLLYNFCSLIYIS